jgi:PAS domain-containing protein
MRKLEKQENPRAIGLLRRISYFSASPIIYATAKIDRMSRAKRALLMLAGLLPMIMVLLATWLVGMSWQLVFAACTAAAISLIITFVATIGPRRHQDALEKINEALDANKEDEDHLLAPWSGADPPAWTMTALTIKLCKRLAERRQQLKITMLDVTNALASLTHPVNQPMHLSPPPCPDPDDSRTLSSTYHIHLKNFLAIRTREIALTQLLKDIPIAVIATDLELKIHYINPAAEHLLGANALKVQQSTLTKHLVEPPASLLSHDVTLPKGIGPKSFYQRLLDNKTKNITVWLKNAQEKVIPVSTVIKLGQHHVFLFQPLGEPMTLAGSVADAPTATGTVTTKKHVPIHAS